jgi:hypothetical protein
MKLQEYHERAAFQTGFFEDSIQHRTHHERAAFQTGFFEDSIQHRTHG